MIGVISDTHGLLREQAVAALRGVDAIIHAGDIGTPEVVEALRAVAPLTVIKGNIDRGEWARAYPDVATMEILGHSIYVVHNLKEMEIDPRGVYSVVVSGHSHIPNNERRDGVLYFNPGSAGPRRFRLPVAVGMLTVSEQRVSGKLIELDVPPPKKNRRHGA
jgi:uncharacterized protein